MALHMTHLSSFASAISLGTEECELGHSWKTDGHETYSQREEMIRAARKQTYLVEHCRVGLEHRENVEHRDEAANTHTLVRATSVNMQRIDAQ